MTTVRANEPEKKNLRADLKIGHYKTNPNPKPRKNQNKRTQERTASEGGPYKMQFQNGDRQLPKAAPIWDHATLMRTTAIRIPSPHSRPRF
jgi:hypothetical protein